MGSASCMRMKDAGLERTVRPGLLSAKLGASPLLVIYACTMTASPLKNRPNYALALP